MTFSHYVDVMIRDQSIALDLHARLLTVVHGVIARHGVQLAAAWPDWQSRAGEFGGLFRVFGDAASLGLFVDGVAPLSRAGFIRPYPVMATPSTVATVAYVKDRQIDRQTPGFMARQSRRHARRHGGEPKAVDFSGDGALAPNHHLRLQSASTGQAYCCFIRQAVAAPVDAGGRAYGLGFTLPNF